MKITKAITLEMRKLIAKLVNDSVVGVGACACCGRKWTLCVGHMTQVAAREYWSCLCEDCWGEMEIEDRIEYYSISVGKDINRDRILSAVRKGL